MANRFRMYLFVVAPDEFIVPVAPRHRRSVIAGAPAAAHVVDALNDLKRQLQLSSADPERIACLRLQGLRCQADPLIGVTRVTCGQECERPLRGDHHAARYRHHLVPIRGWDRLQRFEGRQ